MIKKIHSITLFVLIAIFLSNCTSGLLLSDGDSWYYKGTTLFHKQKYEEALMHFNKAIELNPDDYYAWQLKGSCLTKLRRYDEALKALNKSIYIQEYHPPSWFSKAAVLVELGKYEKAISDIDYGLLVLKSLRQYDGFDFMTDEALHLSSVYGLKGQSLLALKKYREAIESIEKGLAIEPTDYLLWCSKGTAFDGLGEKEAALDAFSKAYKYSDNADICSNVVWMY